MFVSSPPGLVATHGQHALGQVDADARPGWTDTGPPGRGRPTTHQDRHPGPQPKRSMVIRRIAPRTRRDRRIGPPHHTPYACSDQVEHRGRGHDRKCRRWFVGGMTDDDGSWTNASRLSPISVRCAMIASCRRRSTRGPSPTKGRRSMRCVPPDIASGGVARDWDD
jgi:hypothetical protein